MKVAIMGYGTIGSGVAEVLKVNRDLIKRKTGKTLEVKYILDLREFPGDENEGKIIHDFSVIDQDDEVELVVETMGGVNPAYTFVKTCLESGKHVVTSNKALVAAHGTELLSIRPREGDQFPVRGQRRRLHSADPSSDPGACGEKILEITGILNGTTNYILTKMNEEGQTFEAALKTAQELGYAERNPEADVEGYDTCRKISILTALASEPGGQL